MIVGEQGVAKWPWFFLTPSYWGYQPKRKQKIDQNKFRETKNGKEDVWISKLFDFLYLIQELDADVEEERKLVVEGKCPGMAKN